MYGMYSQPSSHDSLANSNQPPMTMMQHLQMERRRRLWEHQQKVSNGEDWPGFNMPLVHNDSLWDPDFKPPMEHDTWSPLNATPVGVVGGDSSSTANTVSFGKGVR